MATATERKFTGLRKRLDQMGYRQSLGLDSLPLVDKLFGDLLHTTESLKTTKQQLGKHREEKNVWEEHVEPYQADNARVINENNKLHQQLIKVQENSEQRIREMKAILRRFEHENSDLKFLNTQYLQRLRSQEKESERKTEKILELQEKNFQAVIQTPGGKKKSIPFRRQRMELDCTLPEASTTTKITSPTPPDPYVADLLQVADQRMSQLQATVELRDRNREKLEDSIQSMRKLIENREKEIERLTEMLKGGRPAEALAAEGIRQSRERMVAHLNIQVDFLQKASHELEKKLSDSEEEKARLQVRVTELSTKNARICSELQEISDMVKQTEQEREMSEEHLKAQINQLKAKVSKGDFEQLESLGLLEDNQQMAKLLADSEGDKKEVANLLERLSEERKNFQRKMKQFKEQETGLHHQIADLERRLMGPDSSAETRKLRKERDDLKGAISSFETELLDIQMDTKVLADDRDNFKLLYEQVSGELSRCKQQIRGPTASGAAILRRMEGEREHIMLELKQKKTECNSLQDRLQSLQDTQQHDLNTLEDKVAELTVEMAESCKEKEELLERLAATKELLTSTESELGNSTQALSTTNVELIHQRSKVTNLQVLVESSERTRQEQHKGMKTRVADVETAQSTIFSLNNKITQLSLELTERGEKITELRHALTALDQDHDSLVGEADRKDEAIASLQAQLTHKGECLNEVMEKLARLQLDLGKKESHYKEKEMEIDQVEEELNRTRRELHSLRDQMATSVHHITELRNDLSTVTQENQAVHNELQHSMEQKTSLDLKLKEYADTLARFEEAACVNTQEKTELIGSYNSLNSQAEKLNATVQGMQDTLSTAKMELMVLAQEKSQVEGVMEHQASEIHTLKTYEQQVSHMSHALSKMEGSLRQEQEEKKALIMDLETTREMCVEIDRSKETLSSQLSTQSMNYESLQSQLGDLQADRDLLKAQLNTERSTAEKLQTLISTEREKEFQSHLRGREKDEEVQHLRQLLAKLEADRLTLAGQTRKLRADTAIQSETLLRLRSELSSEKFQKEQLSLQRTSLTMLTSPSLHADTRTPSPQHRGAASPHPEFPGEPALSSPSSTPTFQTDLHHSLEEDSKDRQDFHSCSSASDAMCDHSSS